MSVSRVKDRRQRPERRLGGERRRGIDARWAMFEVCRSMLHLALVVRANDDGRDKVLTRSVRWRNEATSLNTERGVEELTAAFRTLVAEERLAGARVHIALSGEYCVTRVITGATDEVRREFAELEDRSLRYLTLGPGPKALAGHIQPLDARHQHALLAVANERTLELLMRIGDLVNVQIEAIEPSLLALSRAATHLRGASAEACLMIQLDEEVAELGICHRGRLLLDYRPGGKTNADNVADVARLHLSRLQRYLERYHSYLDAPLRHVYLSGDTAAVERARKAFAKLPEFTAQILEPSDFEMSWDHMAEVPGTDLAAALGTAMAVYSAESEQQGPNLIESALAQLREPMRPILLRSSVPLAAVLLLGLTLLVLHFAQSLEIAGLKAQMEQLAPVCARATEMRLQLTAAEMKLAQLNALQQQLPQTDWRGALERIAQSMPDDVWLDRLTVQDGRTASLVGASYSDGGVYDFVGHLKEVPDISEIALESTGIGHTPTGPTTNFNLQLMLAKLYGRTDQGLRHD
jgi:Tfp pilus assembly protein PilN